MCFLPYYIVNYKLCLSFCDVFMFNYTVIFKMSHKSDSLEVIHEGWLTKSPPTKRIWRARWRRRWFVLRHSGELPGQYFLYYYTDRNCRRLKGQIDLDECEQVDAGLKFENRKQKYQYMFDVKTPKRTYYLAAETEDDMNKWVECVCHVCGLKAYSSEENNFYGYGIEDEPSIADGSTQNTDSPPVSPASTVSGPYIPISECISGKPISSPDGLNSLLALQQQQLQFQQQQQQQQQQQNKNGGATDLYDAPRVLQPPTLELRPSSSTTPPMQSPTTDVESVFTDEEWVNPHPKPVVNWKTFPRPSDSSLEGDVPCNKTAHITVNKRFTKVLSDTEGMPVPPRPPKPAHLVSVDSTDQHQYMNLGNENENNNKDESTDDNINNTSITGGISDDMYDFPRSHHNINGSVSESINLENIDGVIPPIPMARHCYTNAAPSNVGNGNVFRYDFDLTPTDETIQPMSLSHHNQQPVGQYIIEPQSPASEGSSTALYSNLPSPSPSLKTPTISTTNLNSTNAASSPVNGPPVVYRDLKPGRKHSDSVAGSNEPSPIPLPAVSGQQPPPNVDRALKPTPAVRKKRENSEDSTTGPLKLCPPPLGRVPGIGGDFLSHSLSRQRRAAPSPTLPISNPRRHSDTSEPDLRTIANEAHHLHENRLIGASLCSYGSKRWDEIQYLDLDLEGSSGTSPSATSTSPSCPVPTVYKTVDFLKTEAFNRTRLTVEKERQLFT